MLNDQPADSRDHQSERMVLDFADGSVLTIAVDTNLRKWENLRGPNGVKIGFLLRFV